MFKGQAYHTFSEEKKAAKITSMRINQRKQLTKKKIRQRLHNLYADRSKDIRNFIIETFIKHMDEVPWQLKKFRTGQAVRNQHKN